jgi:TM2 domain-containing membrane protein YozV
MNGTQDRPDPLTPQPAPADPTATQPLSTGPPVAPHAAAPQVAAPPVQGPAVQTPDPRTKSPALACVLSAMPGLGQIYVGYYQRGFIHAIVVAILISMLNLNLEEATPLVALFMAFFWLYNIIDAGRRATLYNQVLAGSESIEMPSDFKMPRFRGSIFAGLVLIGIGFILLLHTRYGVSLEWIEEWWPVAPMLLGAYLVIKAIQDRLAGSED